MSTFRIGGCSVTILPVIKGLVSEYDRVKQAITSDYDCIAVSLGLEEIEVIRASEGQEWDYDPSNLDSVYAHHLKNFGEVSVPVPAFKAVIDACKDMGVQPMPLDMCDEDFTKMYCDLVSTFDLLKENRVLKKSMKTKFDLSSPEAFVRQWDDLINTIKGQYAVSLRREEYIAGQLVDLSNYKKNVLAIIEYERVDGIMIELEGKIDLRQV